MPIEKLEQQTDRDWWRELGALCTWRTFGWTNRFACTYLDRRGKFVELSGDQRDDIMEAIRRAGHAS